MTTMIYDILIPLSGGIVFYGIAAAIGIVFAKWDVSRR